MSDKIQELKKESLNEKYSGKNINIEGKFGVIDGIDLSNAHNISHDEFKSKIELIGQYHSNLLKKAYYSKHLYGHNTEVYFKIVHKNYMDYVDELKSKGIEKDSPEFNIKLFEFAKKLMIETDDFKGITYLKDKEFELGRALSDKEVDQLTREYQENVLISPNYRMGEIVENNLGSSFKAFVENTWVEDFLNVFGVDIGQLDDKFNGYTKELSVDEIKDVLAKNTSLLDVRNETRYIELRNLFNNPEDLRIVSPETYRIINELNSNKNLSPDERLRKFYETCDKAAFERGIFSAKELKFYPSEDLLDKEMKDKTLSTTVEKNKDREFHKDTSKKTNKQSVNNNKKIKYNLFDEELSKEEIDLKLKEIDLNSKEWLNETNNETFILNQFSDKYGISKECVENINKNSIDLDNSINVNYSPTPNKHPNRRE